MLSWLFLPKPSQEHTKSFSAAKFTSDDLLKIIDGTFFFEGYTQLIFFGFDFTKDTQYDCVLDKNKPYEKTTIFLSKIIPSINCNAYIFHNTVFTAPQVKVLLENNCNLSLSTYKLNEPIEFLEYYEDFYPLCNSENYNRLHGVQVNFHDCDLATAEENILSVCSPVTFMNTTVSQAQIIALIANKSATKSIDLCHISFEKTEIAELIEKYHTRLSFEGYSTSSDKISLRDSSINNAILDVKTLAFFALNPEYHHWFFERDFSFSLKFDDVIIPGLTVDALLEKCLVGQTPRTTSVHSPLSFFDALYTTIKNDGAIKELEAIRKLIFSEMNPVKKMLWVFYCAENHPATDIGKKIWRLLGINKKYGYVSAPTAETLEPW
ncbi:MAG: hypothetical protein Q8L78_08945 [Coxiellaceae bacterium]|nr:hypothetical protein [Coxiellaceae bacterium]